MEGLKHEGLFRVNRYCKIFSLVPIIRPMTLEQFIRKHGTAHCAERWQVTQRIVQLWLIGEHKPQKRHAERIVALGDMTRRDIYA